VVKKKSFGITIKKWLDEEFPKTILTSDDQFEFSIEIENAVVKGLNIVISQPKEKNVVGIVCQLRLPKDVTNIVKEFTDEQKVKLTQSLHRELLKMIQDHTVDKNLDFVLITERVYFDNLNRQKLMDGITKIRNVMLYLISLIRDKFGGFDTPPPSTPDNSMYG